MPTGKSVKEGSVAMATLTVAATDTPGVKVVASSESLNMSAVTLFA